MKKFDEVLFNEYGYYELEHPLKPEEIRRIFEEEYFQNSMSNYEQLYDEDELKFFENKMMQKELRSKHIFRKRSCFFGHWMRRGICA